MPFTAEASPFHEVEGEHGKRIARRVLCKPKDVKLPTMLGILHTAQR